MNPEQLQQQIALSYSKLPPDAQQVFSNMIWMETLKTISIKYNLNNAQIETLATETTLALLGIIRTEEYEDNLKKELGMQDAILAKMMEEIDNTVFNNIKPLLADAYDTHVASLVEEKYGDLSKLDERFAKLPQEVQVAIMQSDYQNVLFSIGTENKLNIEQMGSLEEVTNKVLLGIIHPDKYEIELQGKLPITADKVAMVVKSVNEKILLPIREILKSNWGNEGPSAPSSMDDEVPLPPYIEELRSAVKSSINTTPAPNMRASMSESRSSLPINTSSASSANPSVDIFANKLNQMVMSKNVVTDQSMSKITPTPKAEAPISTPPPQATSKVIHDPYHESI